MKKKAEIKFGETLGIIILVYIIIMVGMVWYNNINNTAILELKQESQNNNAFQKYYFIINSDLIHQSQLGDVDEELDLVSIQTFANYSKNNGKEYIRKKLGESIIYLELYDKDMQKIEGLEESIILYHNVYENEQTKNRDTFKSIVPVVHPIEKQTYIGVLTVVVYN